MKQFFPVIYISILSCSVLLFGQDKVDYEFDPIIVTANRIPTLFSKIGKSVTVITAEEIKSSPANSVQELLAYVGSVDLVKRGPAGVQAEAGIRGGSFEETLILIDGVKINDPQTAHHNLDLPVSLYDIERIEILRGHGTGLYGADALAGVINVITKNIKGTTLHATWGDYGYIGGHFSLSRPVGKMKNRISLTKKRSDGYIEYTNFDILNASYQASLPIRKKKVDFFVGYTDKKFGANSFYSEQFPNEREHTETLFVKTETWLNCRWMSVMPRLYWRAHDDDFILDNARPDWYRNQHKTHVYGLEVPFELNTDIGTILVASEAKKESITSSSLGHHSRILSGISLVHHLNAGSRCGVNSAIHFFHYCKWGWKVWPGMDVRFHVLKDLFFYASAGRSFRMPSFTELYYKSPANVGNPQLTYSEAESYEIGTRWVHQYTIAGMNFFTRKGRNVIDWARHDPGSAWQVENLSRINTNGIEIDLHLVPDPFPVISSINCSLTLVHSDKSTGDYESKYALNYLKNQFIIGIENRLLFGLKGNWKCQWKKRAESRTYFLLDAAIVKEYKSWDFLLKATNVLNTDYVEIVGVPMPGRWISMGINFRLFSKN